jgi:hypothetical protein
VELFLGMRAKLQPFIIFLLLITGLFSVIFTINGCTFGEGATTWYPFFNFMQTFEFAIGNMPGIETPFWDKYKADHSDAWLPGFMIYVIYIWYILTEVFIFIILINFFIAEVG